jgi:multiple sugar transport system ATP-binding protein
MTQIHLQHIHKRYGATSVVKDLNLQIADQEFLVLLGPSGCGKTTTMRMIAGLEQASEGTIAFNGQRVNEVPTQKRDVAMVFQNYGLYPHMNVARNIGYPLKLRGIPLAEQQDHIERAAKRVELMSYLHRLPRELSGGQRQRVALARSIVRQPKVFLMDEPLSNLDAKLRVAMRAEIKHLAHEMKVTTVYVTHDQVEAMTLAHRVALMKDGEIQQLATPEEIYNNPANAFVAGFIGSPAMNLVSGAGNTGRFEVAGTSTSVPCPCAGAVTLGVRAEDASLCAADEGQLSADVFTFELLGDATMASVKLGANLLTIKAPKDTRLQMGERIGIRLNTQRLYWFDAQSGQRIRHAGVTTEAA